MNKSKLLKSIVAAVKERWVNKFYKLALLSRNFAVVYNYNNSLDKSSIVLNIY